MVLCAYDSAPPPVPPPAKYVLQSDVKLLAKKLPDCSVYEGPASKNKPLCDAAADSVDCFNISHVVDVLQSKKKDKKKLLRSLLVVHFDLLRLETIKSVTEN